MKKLMLAALAAVAVPAAHAQATLDRPFNEYTWLTAHNAFANTLVPGQTLSLGAQLQRGVRGLMLDIHESNGRVRLCHGSCLGTEPTLADALNNHVLPFMRQVPQAIVTLHLEDYTSRAALAAELSLAPEAARLSFSPEQWTAERWPTPREMADAGQRLVIFTQRRDNAGALPTAGGPTHVLYDRTYTSENHWELGRTIFEHDASCTSRWESPGLSNESTWGPREWPRLFVMNHFHGAPLGNHSATDNSYDALRSRIDDHCRPAAGRKPNYVAVDFVEAGQAASVVAALNAGVIEFFDEPAGKGERICAVAAGARRTVMLEEYAGDRCPPDRLRSAVVRDVAAGTRIELAEAATHDSARTIITVKHDLDGERALVHDLRAAQEDEHLKVTSSASGFAKGVLQVAFSAAR
ncbi:hypothetical protein [Luteibacter sp.]|uniref:hypothetical protein n=1 Tax=Luteibacter sp. TaxID=1886636 RepID=UPI003F80D795